MAEGGGEQKASGGTPTVFVSYASQDTAVANAIVTAMERQGLKCWIAPRDVVPGTLYADEIVKAINEATVVVLVLSEQAVASPHVGKEIERASSKRRPIIALHTDSAPLTRTFEYFLSESQWIEIGPVGIEAASEKLVAAARRHVESTVATAPGVETLVADGSKPDVHSDSRAAGTKSAASSRTRVVIIAAFATVVIVALGYAVVDKLWLSKDRATTQRGGATSSSATTPAAAAVNEKSIAVLPFTDLSEKKDQEYFADGMAEEVLDLLSQIPGLTVIGRTSSFQFKGVNQDLRVVGRTLGVTYVLEGSVRRSLDRLRVTAQLIDTRTGTHRWSETYDRAVADTLQVQDEIAASLVRALEVAVGANRPQSKRRTQNVEAYDLYLRATFARDRHDRDGLAKAATYYQQALRLDPTFAEAAAGLAVTVYEQANTGYVSQSEGFSRARLAAQTAIKLDPALGMAHAVLGVIYAEHDWDYDASERESKLALALVPHDAMVVALASHLPQMLGQDDTARRMLTESLAYDPLFAPAYDMLATVEAHSGHWSEAEAAERRAVQISPAFGHFELGEILLLRGDKNAALAEFMREEDHIDRTVGLALVYHALNRKAEADAALRTVTTEGGNDHAYEIAEVHAYRGEVNEALQWLDRLYDRKDSDLSNLKENALFKTLETDPRYKALLRKMKLPE
jgi:TolB-like protein/Tfp pilus assembly protein PilF